jgi:hypothetical protein
MYGEILEKESVDHISIYASRDGFSKDELSRAKKIIKEDVSKLQGLELEGNHQNGQQFSIVFDDA